MQVMELDRRSFFRAVFRNACCPQLPIIIRKCTAT